MKNAQISNRAKCTAMQKSKCIVENKDIIDTSLKCTRKFLFCVGTQKICFDFVKTFFFKIPFLTCKCIIY